MQVPVQPARGDHESSAKRSCRRRAHVRVAADLGERGLDVRHVGAQGKDARAICCRCQRGEGMVHAAFRHCDPPVVLDCVVDGGN
eukprot:2792800-Alexandrium_andersonii.AAC.1